MPSLYDRISRRLEDGRDEYYEFESDLENGRRNMFGLKTEKWHDREKERQRQRDKRRHGRDDPKHRAQANRTHDRARAEGRDTGHDRARSTDRDRGHGRSRHADDKDKGRGSDRPEDRDRRQHVSHRGSSRGIDASNAGAERRKKPSKQSNTTHPHLRVRDVLVDVAGKVIEDLLGGSAPKPEKHRKHRRRHRPETNRENGGEDGERQHKDRARTPERKPVEPAQQHGGPSGPLQDHGEAGSYYQGHPLKHQQPSGGRPQGSPSQRQPNNAPLQSHSRAPEKNGPAPPRSSQGLRSGENPPYGNSRSPKRDEERQQKTGPETREARLRRFKPQPRDLEEEQFGDSEEARENSERPRSQGAAAHEAPGKSSTRDFGQSPRTGKSPQDTVTSTSINGDSDREDETDGSTAGSRRSSLLTEQPTKKCGQHPKNGKSQRGGEHHHDYAEDSNEGRSEAEELHVRGGGQYDDNEDVDSDAQYSEYEEFDDEYLGEVHVLRDDLCQTRTAPVVNKQEGYSPLSYVAAKMKSGAYSSNLYDHAEPKTGGYSPLSYSYAAAKAKTVHIDYTSEIHLGNSSKAFYEHCGRPDRLGPNPSSKGISASERLASHSPNYMPKYGYEQKEYSHTPLRKAPEPHGAFIDSESERPRSSETSKSKNKSGKSNVSSSDYERSRDPEPSQSKSKPRKFNVRFEDRSESSSPGPKHAPKSKRPSRGIGCDTAGKFEEPPPNHYATLEISPSTNPETSVDILLLEVALLTSRLELQSWQRKCVLRFIPTC